MTPDAKIFHELWQSAELELREAELKLQKIALMDPFGVRVDDLGRAARIARDAVAAISARDRFESIIASLNYDGQDINSLTVGEIRRALPALPPSHSEGAHGTEAGPASSPKT